MSRLIGHWLKLGQWPTVILYSDYNTQILTVSSQKLSLVGLNTNQVRRYTSDSHTIWLIELTANASTSSSKTISEGPKYNTEYHSVTGHYKKRLLECKKEHILVH